MVDGSNTYAVIAFVLLFIPFAFIWLRIFRRYNERKLSVLGKWILGLIAFISFALYYYFNFWIGQIIDGTIGDAILLASWATVIFSIIPFLAASLALIILTILYYSSKKQR